MRTFIQWLLGALLILLSFGAIKDSVAGSVSLFLGGALAVPPLWKLLSSSTPFTYRKTAIAILGIIGMIAWVASPQFRARTAEIKRANQQQQQQQRAAEAAQSKAQQEKTEPASGLSSSSKSDSHSGQNGALGLRWLPPAVRFTEYAPSDSNWNAQKALNAGDVETAYNSFGERDRSLDGPREKRFDDVLEIAYQQSTNTSPSSDYVERVKTYWLPEVRAMTATPSADPTTCVKQIISLEALREELDASEGLAFTPHQSAIVRTFKTQLSARQKALLPSLRARCGSQADEQLRR